MRSDLLINSLLQTLQVSASIRIMCAMATRTVRAEMRNTKAASQHIHLMPVPAARRCINVRMACVSSKIKRAMASPIVAMVPMSLPHCVPTHVPVMEPMIFAARTEPASVRTCCATGEMIVPTTRTRRCAISTSALYRIYVNTSALTRWWAMSAIACPDSGCCPIVRISAPTSMSAMSSSPAHRLASIPMARTSVCVLGDTSCGIITPARPPAM